MNIPIAPGTRLKIIKLWPHARKQGKELGQIWKAGYYCKDCGEETIWLVDEKGNYSWTVDVPFLKKYFDVI